MFRIQQSDSYRWPVLLPLVGEDGAVENHQFHLKFKRLDSAQVAALGERVDRGELTDPVLVRQIVVGFGDDVAGPDGQALPFSPQALDDLLAIHRAPYFICRAFYDSLRAEVKEAAQEKN